jgi:hypothetical protein
VEAWRLLTFGREGRALDTDATLNRLVEHVVTVVAVLEMSVSASPPDAVPDSAEAERDRRQPPVPDGAANPRQTQPIPYQKTAAASSAPRHPSPGSLAAVAGLPRPPTRALCRHRWWHR